MLYHFKDIWYLLKSQYYSFLPHCLCLSMPVIEFASLDRTYDDKQTHFRFNILQIIYHDTFPQIMLKLEQRLLWRWHQQNPHWTEKNWKRNNKEKRDDYAVRHFPFLHIVHRRFSLKSTTVRWFLACLYFILSSFKFLFLTNKYSMEIKFWFQGLEWYLLVIDDWGTMLCGSITRYLKHEKISLLTWNKRSSQTSICIVRNLVFSELTGMAGETKVDMLCHNMLKERMIIWSVQSNTLEIKLDNTVQQKSSW